VTTAPKKATRRARKPSAPAVTPRVARRERRRERSREEILEATRAVLLREGIAATTLDAVAREVGVSKTAIYYYFASKDALFFELVFRSFEESARVVHDAVEKVDGGGDALRALIGETVRGFAGRLDDFRLTFLSGQVAGPGSLRIEAEQLARIRPLNDLMYAGTARLLAAERRRGPARAKVEPRLLTFLAHMSAIGVLTMKGMVESVGDPLLYSDDQLIEGLARIFEAAASADPA
jgi:AcrR family transcriptional regulator